MLSWERQRLLHEHLMYLKDVERARNFSWDDWRKRVSRLKGHPSLLTHSSFFPFAVPQVHEPQEITLDRSVP